MFGEVPEFILRIGALDLQVNRGSRTEVRGSRIYIPPYLPHYRNDHHHYHYHYHYHYDYYYYYDYYYDYDYDYSYSYSSYSYSYCYCYYHQPFWTQIHGQEN